MEEKKIGEVTHYFGNIGVAIVRLDKDGVKTGDTVRFKGHTSDFVQKIDSLQIEHQKVREAKKNEQVGIKVEEHAREGDAVYKVLS